MVHTPRLIILNKTNLDIYNRFHPKSEIRISKLGFRI
jgi:hypothetical protein